MSNFDKNDVKVAKETVLGLKPSKKFANGTVHENGTGKFEILDRYLENNIIMLKYKWLTGEFEGKEEVNKEVNINSSIWKFKKVRGLTGKQQNEPSTTYANLDEVMEKLEEIQEFQQENLSEYMNYMEDIHNKVIEQSKELMTVFRKIDKVLAQIDDLHKRYELTSKLIDKM
ncbi:hypothetical protein JMM81_21170 [Bacillus sp. V3B]|uniref:hypothetical protein n=1 Tax=Bacillus sp. V3B TaxID=2804915 RepID=UPI002109F05D|nr:hypothetical protein [Bacillus sp. V3B]MCQ6277382.1 hypothetical protein [Bacillus sp. V3B]